MSEEGSSILYSLDWEKTIWQTLWTEKNVAAVCLPAWRETQRSCCSLTLVNLHLSKLRHTSFSAHCWMSSQWCWIYHFLRPLLNQDCIELLDLDSFTVHPVKNETFLGCFHIKKVFFFWPDGDNLTRVEVDTIHLGNEDGCHSLIQSSSVHVDRGSHREHKTGDPFVNPQILFQAPEGNRKCTSTG